MPPLDAAVMRMHRDTEIVLDRQVTLSRVPAPTGDEGARSKRLVAMLRESVFGRVSGAHVRQDAVGNVIARLEPLPAAHTASLTSSRAQAVAPVVCMAHLDTVFDGAAVLTPQRDGSVVTCPGIGDNGRGLAALVSLAEQFAHADVRGCMQRPIEFVASVGEEGEGNLRGARAYFDAMRDGATSDDDAQDAAPSAVLVLDGPGDSTIVHHAVASARFRVRYLGPGGHSWTDRRAPNPIHALAATIARIARFASGLPATSSVAVTRTGGGEFITSIAREAWCDVDVRACDGSVLARHTAEVRRIAMSLAAPCTCEIVSLGERPGGSLESSHPLVMLAADVTRWCGIEPQSAMASTDANIPLSRGIPAITIGAGGSGGGAHTAGEWFDNSNGSRGLVRAFGMLAGLVRA